MLAVAGLNLEQVVIVADEFCARTGAKIASYPALAAISGASHPSLHGVPVYRDAAEQARGVRGICRRVGALSHGNEGFAEVLCEILAARAEAAARR